MRRFVLTLLLGVLPIAAAAETVPVSVPEAAEKALEKGYGASCSLEMLPVEGGAYYPCLDFGPYRYVRKYGHSDIYVAMKDRKPFLVASGPAQAMKWTVVGPWMQDISGRMALWWADTVEGAALKKQMTEAEAEAQAAAAEYIRSLNGDPPKSRTVGSVTEPTAAIPTLPQPTRTAASPATVPGDEISPDILELLSK